MKCTIKIVLLIISINCVYFCECSNSTNVAYMECKKTIKKIAATLIEIEKNITRDKDMLENINHQEKLTSPVIKNIYEVLYKCFSMLHEIGRNSKYLTLFKTKNKNDFIRSAIVMKNCSHYFNRVKNQLGKTTGDIHHLYKLKAKHNTSMKNSISTFETQKQKLDEHIKIYKKIKPTNEIQKNIIAHIASRTETIDELDAELEAENAVGGLKNNMFYPNGELTMSFPIVGKIFEEFGDKTEDDDMSSGLTLNGRAGSVVVSPAAGIVSFAGAFLNHTSLIIINSGDYRIFLYGICKAEIDIGDKINIGDYIGELSNISSQATLKIELRKSGDLLDPRHWFTKGNS